MAESTPILVQKVPLLTRENWPVWSERMGLLLRLHKCWEAVRPPSAASSSSSASAATSQAPSVSAEEDSKALAYIGLHVADEYLQHVANATSARALWCTFEGLFVTRIAAQKLNLKRQLTTLKQGGQEPFEDFFNRALELRQRLAAIKVEVSDDDLASALLAGAGESYTNTAEALAVSTTELDLEVIRIKMMAAEERLGILRKGRPVREPANTIHALQAQARPVRKCWNCGRAGHIAAKCRQPKSKCAGCGEEGHTRQYCKQSSAHFCQAERTVAL